MEWSLGMRKSHRSQETGTEIPKNKKKVMTEKTRQCSPGKTKSSALPGFFFRQISREEGSIFTWKIMCWPGFDPNNNHQSNHQLAKRLITEFMNFKWVFERLHHDSLESNVNCYGKPAKIIDIIKALYQGWACAKYMQARGNGLHR